MIIAHCSVFIYNRGMSITLQEVRHVAELAKLHLSEAEEKLYQVQLSAILDYAQRLNVPDTASIPPTATVLPLHSVMRDDEARPSLPVADILANAPARADDAFEVHAVLE